MAPATNTKELIRKKISCYTTHTPCFTLQINLKDARGPKEENFLWGLKEIMTSQFRSERSAGGWEEEYLNT